LRVAVVILEDRFVSEREGVAIESEAGGERTICRQQQNE